MNRDEIKLAILMIARGQVNHPAVEQMADELTALLSQPVMVLPADPTIMEPSRPGPAYVPPAATLSKARKR